MTSDVADEVHVHFNDDEKDVAAGGTVTFDFTADKPGVYEVELHEPDPAARARGPVSRCTAVLAGAPGARRRQPRGPADPVLARADRRGAVALRGLVRRCSRSCGREPRLGRAGAGSAAARGGRAGPRQPGLALGRSAASASPSTGYVVLAAACSATTTRSTRPPASSTCCSGSGPSPFASVAASGRCGGWLNPVRTLHLLLCRAAAARPAGRPRSRYPGRLGYWPAAAGLLAFAWLELVAAAARHAAGAARLVSAPTSVRDAGRRRRLRVALVRPRRRLRGRSRSCTAGCRCSAAAADGRSCCAARSTALRRRRVAPGLVGDGRA